MKKYISGFVPANFNLTGKILLVMGIIFLIAKITAYFTKLFNVPSILLFLGVGLVIIGLYLTFIVPKE